MIKILYSIKDTKAGYFLNAVPFENDSVALRSFKQMVNDKRNDSVLSLYPADCEIWKLGTYDTKTGVITSELEFSLSAIDLKDGD